MAQNLKNMLATPSPWNLEMQRPTRELARSDPLIRLDVVLGDVLQSLKRRNIYDASSDDIQLTQCCFYRCRATWCVSGHQQQ